MNIMIVGCGKVGATLAEKLSNEGHDLVLVDLNGKRVEEVATDCDAMGIAGNGASFNVQMEAGVESTDLLIAVTGSDELNLLCCLIARKAGNCHTIARVRNPLYSKELSFIKERLGISMIINPEFAAAEEISRILRFPSAIKIEPFAKGKVELLQFKLSSKCGLDGSPVSAISSKLHCDVLVCAVERGEQITIPNGDFILQDGDKISIMAAPVNSARFFRKIGLDTHQVKDAMIVGGGTIAYYLAKQLLGMGIKVRIIELDQNRCAALSELLPNAVILCGDGTDHHILLEEGLETAESIVSLTNMDEENILLSLFAKKHSRAKAVAKVNRIAFDDIIDGLDIGSVIYPKYITADYILQYVRAMNNSIESSNVETLYKILDDRAEALEFSVKEPSAVTDVPLNELDLKENLLITCIYRNGKVKIPRGHDVIKVGDTVIVIATEGGFNNICDILKR